MKLLVDSVWRIMQEDWVRWRWLIGGWWLLTFTAWFVGVTHPVEEQTSLRFSLFQWVRWLGPLLCGVIASGHALTRRGAWRTRPWRWHDVLVAKVLGVMLFVWLPAALAQLFMLGAFGDGNRQPLRYLLELLVTPGGMMLAFAALGAASSSWRNYLALGIAAVAGNLFVKVALDRWYDGYGDIFVWLDALIVLAAASLALLVLYRTRSRRSAVLAALVPLLLWPAVYSLDRLPSRPAPAQLSVVGLKPGPPWPIKAVTQSRSGAALCVRFEIEGWPQDLDSWRLEVNGRFNAGGEGDLLFRTQRATELDSFWHAETERFDVMLSSWSLLDPSRLGERGELKIEFSLVRRHQEWIATQALAEGARFETIDSAGQLARFDVEEVVGDNRAERSYVRIAQTPRLVHATGKRPRFIVWAEGDESQWRGGAAASQRTLFPAAQDFELGWLGLEFPAGAPETFELYETEELERLRFKATLSDVTLEDLLCKAARGGLKTHV